MHVLRSLRLGRDKDLQAIARLLVNPAVVSHPCALEWAVQGVAAKCVTDDGQQGTVLGPANFGSIITRVGMRVTTSTAAPGQFRANRTRSYGTMRSTMGKLLRYSACHSAHAAFPAERVYVFRAHGVLWSQMERPWAWNKASAPTESRSPWKSSGLGGRVRASPCRAACLNWPALLLLPPRLIGDRKLLLHPLRSAAAWIQQDFERLADLLQRGLSAARAAPDRGRCGRGRRPGPAACCGLPGNSGRAPDRPAVGLTSWRAS